jgi:putative transposase
MDKGFDGHKKSRAASATSSSTPLGSVLAAHVEPAHENDRVGTKAALKKLAQQVFERLSLV